MFFTFSDENLQWGLCHELGHSLGLNHSNLEDALMFSHSNRNNWQKLHRDDTDGITHLYPRGRPSRLHPNSLPATRAPTTFQHRQSPVSPPRQTPSKPSAPYYSQKQPNSKYIRNRPRTPNYAPPGYVPRFAPPNHVPRFAPPGHIPNYRPTRP